MVGCRGRCLVALTLTLVTSGCVGSEESLGAGTPPEQDASTSASESSTSATAAADVGGPPADDGEPGPSKTPPFSWPPLPDGCGDGVVVSGRYDCFRAVPLPEGEPLATADLNGDGRDELLAYGPGVDDIGCPDGRACNRIWIHRLDGDDDEPTLETTVGPFTVQPGVLHVFTDRDVTGDGRADLLQVPTHNGYYYFHAGLPGGALGPWDSGNVWNDTPAASAAPVLPVDPLADGHPGFLVSDYSGGGDVQLRRLVDGQWTGVGEPLTLPGCKLLGSATYGDFDEDGFEDIAVMESGSGCDPYPKQYDPNHYRLSVYTSDPADGALVQRPSVAAGGIPAGSIGFWTFDVDGDGHLDLVYNTYGITVAFGHGDGTFEDGDVRDDLEDGVGLWLKAKAYGDFDGDGGREFTGSMTTDAGAQEQWIVASTLAPASLARHYPFRLIGGGRFVVGDLNGDGITDFVTEHPDDDQERRWLMVSAP